MPKAILGVLPEILFSSNNTNEKCDHKKTKSKVGYVSYTYIYIFFACKEKYISNVIYD